MTGCSATRRRFIQGAATGVLGALSGCASVNNAASRKLRVAVAGVRVQGRRHLSVLLRDPRVELVGLADPDSALLMQANALAIRFGANPTLTQDPRELLARSDLDVLTVATPDHWHAWLALRACESGKHVFVETPAAHSVEEGESMLATARRHGRHVQVALGSRTCRGMQEGMAFVHGGGIGRIRSIRCVCYARRHPIGRLQGPGEVPAHVDFDIWRGPSPRVPLARRRLHGDWRFDWRTGSGELGEAGSELFDLARWALGRARPARWPDRIWTCGGRLGARDDGQTPNTLLAVLDFGGIPVVFDQRGLPTGYESGGRMDRYRGLRYGVVIEGDGRSLVIEPTRPGCVVFDDRRNLVQQFDGGGHPLVEFLAAIRGQGTLSADIEVGRAASDLAQLVVACHRTAAPATRIEAIRSTLAESGMHLGADPDLTAEFDAFDMHVGRNGFDLDHERPNVSGWQAIDPGTGEFRNNPAANAMRRRSYTAPFLLRPGEGRPLRSG